VGKLSRDKGASHERKTAAALRNIFPGAKRMVQAPTYESRIEEPDVEAGPLDIECKHKKNVSRPAAIREAKQHCREGRVWATVTREHGALVSDTEITMPLEAFIEICSELIEIDPAHADLITKKWWDERIKKWKEENG
jgi:hypothetical protein